MTVNLKEIVENLIDNFLEAGDLAIQLREKGLVKKIKSDNTPVSNGDLEVNKFISKKISEVTPNLPIISEETSENKDNLNLKDFWLVDPIDGTSNFMHGIPHFAISIALEKKDEIIAGIIFDPIKNEIFYAEKNSGAYFNNHRVRVSSKIDLEECLFSSNSYGVKFATPNLNMRNTGCAALDLAYVGSGRLDGFFHNKINIWDIAAGILIIDEAGGKVSDISAFGDEAIDIRASNSNIYQKMLEKIKNF